MTAPAVKISRRAALAGALVTAAAPTAASALAFDSDLAPAPDARFAAVEASRIDDLRRRFSEASERAMSSMACFDAARERLFADAFPGELLLRPEDDSELRAIIDELGEHAPGRSDPCVFGQGAVEELYRQRAERRVPWRPALADADLSDALQRARARRREILAAADLWELNKAAAHRLTGYGEAGEAADEAWTQVFAVAREIFELHASAGAIGLKLGVFSFLVRAHVAEGGAASADELVDGESPAALAATYLAIDLAALAGGASAAA